MRKPKINVQETIEELAERFIDEELSNMISVASRLNKEPHEFIQDNYPGGIYSFLTVNGDVSVKYLRDHAPGDVFKKLNNKHYDSFIRMVDAGVNKEFRWYLNSHQAA